MPDWLKLYHRFPYPIRVLAASARGYYLRWWRYGPEQEHLVEEALHRETWSCERWRQWREERLAYVLDRAATSVPYYRQQWQERRREGDQAAWDMLENWPVLKKEALRETPHAFVAEDCDTRTMFLERTSGTTGKPLQLWWSRETVRQWYALHEARTRQWYDVDYKDRWAMLGGQLVTPFDQTCPPFWVWNAGLRQLYLSAFHLAPAYAAAYLEAMRRHRVMYLFGYASAMYALAQLILEKDWERPALCVAVSNAEPFYLHQRQAIEQAFQCPTRDTYGMAEIVAGASECEAGTVHLWPEVGNVEVLHDSADDALSPGQTGRLVCTGLLNADMPLIRYEIGDLGSLAFAGSCLCGCLSGSYAPTPGDVSVWLCLGHVCSGPTHSRKGLGTACLMRSRQ